MSTSATSPYPTVSCRLWLCGEPATHRPTIRQPGGGCLEAETGSRSVRGCDRARSIGSPSSSGGRSTWMSCEPPSRRCLPRQQGPGALPSSVPAGAPFPPVAAAHRAQPAPNTAQISTGPTSKAQIQCRSVSRLPSSAPQFVIASANKNPRRPEVCTRILPRSGRAALLGPRPERRHRRSAAALPGSLDPDRDTRLHGPGRAHRRHQAKHSVSGR